MDETTKLSAKTRTRTLEPINKHGYMDGAADGQDASFQTSFNMGYEQGFGFGLELGINEALAQLRNKPMLTELQDPRRINCRVCISNTEAKEKNIVNIYNKQKEKNDEYLKKLNQ